MVIDGDPTSVEEQASPGQDQPAWDFSSLHGFQFVGANDASADADASSDDRRRAALTLELDARAARFRQAVDASIVLASDGMIRWLGDPIARLAPGEDLLRPRTILLADPAMSEESQKTVLARLDLWLDATVQRLLGPLFGLRAMQEGSQPLQDLAARIANALGVLDREPVRGIVRNLDQTSRGLLRKHGVRFGSYYLYVPSTLRPAARALALQLSSIRKGDEEFTAAAQGLIPMASSGRTSAVPDARVDAETYRVGGFRACGERVVRVDIVERLADMIRAGSVLRVVGSDAAPAGFQVTSQMTSLTGCSGDGFASILKSLGFESQTVRRSEVVWPAAAAPVAPAAVDTAAAGDNVEGPGESDAAAPASDATDGQAETATNEFFPAEEPERDAAPSLTLADGVDIVCDSEAAETESGPSPDDGIAEDLAPAEADEAQGVAEPREIEASETAPEGIETEGTETVATETEPLENKATETEATADVAAEGPPPAASGAPDVHPPEAEAAGDVAAAHPAPAAAEDETVTIWRFIRVRVPHPARRPRPARRTTSAPAERPSQPQAASAASGEAAPDAGQPPDAQAPSEKRARRFDRPFPDKRKPWEGDKGKRPAQENGEGRRGPEGRSGGGRPGGDRPGGDRRPAVDPMSPFAKLMELRSILEAESKKRR